MRKFLLLASVFSLAACGEQIDTGNRGVRTFFGEISSVEPLREGLYFYSPIGGNVIEYECKNQVYELKLDTYTKDMQTAELKVAVNYNVDGEKVINLHREIGTAYRNKILEPKVTAAVKDVVGQWDAANLVANREKATDQIKQLLTKEIEPFYLHIVSVALSNIDYSDAFERAIEAKVVATQKAEEAKNRTAEIQEQAKQKVLAAEAEAKSMAIRSEALSKNQNLVAYEAVQKWDGRLPVNIYGSAPIPFINAVK